jgi:hypothetical protein
MQARILHLARSLYRLTRARARSTDGSRRIPLISPRRLVAEVISINSSPVHPTPPFTSQQGPMQTTTIVGQHGLEATE